ncbi:MAG: hypothetical protein ACREUC_17710 [Steroidobacteraceae bacterium]
MSAAMSGSAQVRRPATAPSQAPAARAPARGTSFVLPVTGQDYDEIKLHLNDIPRMEMSMDVEGFKPSLLSRLLNLIAPIRA